MRFILNYTTLIDIDYEIQSQYPYKGTSFLFKAQIALLTSITY